MTPAIGIPLERVAPAEGMELCGQFFQAGTVLGVNVWVVHMDRGIYGEDAAVSKVGGGGDGLRFKLVLRRGGRWIGRCLL